MKKRVFSRSLSILLAVMMVISSMVVTTLPTVAEDVETTYTAPEIVVEGAVDVWDGETYTEPATSDKDGYILITSAAEFAWFLQNTTLTPDGSEKKNYRLTTNVDMATASVFLWDENRDFDGIFDGAGHVISNLKATQTGDGAVSLFNQVKGTLKNFTLQNFVASARTKNPCSFIYSLEGGQLLNVRVDISLTGKGAALVLSGSDNALVEDVVLSGSVSSSSGGGGGSAAALMQESKDSGITIRNCVNYASVKNSIGNAAGIIASMTGTTAGGNKLVEYCVNYGTITVSRDNVSAGGIVGTAQSTVSDPATIRGCINYGTVTNTYAKGLAHGICNSTTIKSNDGLIFFEDCVNHGTIQAGQRVGGIASSLAGSAEMTNCANYGDVTSTNSHAGGLAGQVHGNADLTSNGLQSALKLFNCANYGAVKGVNAGGFAGYVKGAQSRPGVQGLYAYGAINAGTITGSQNQGAAVGYLELSGGQSVFTLELVLENVFLNGPALGIGSQKLTAATFGSNVYIDMTDASAFGTANDGHSLIPLEQFHQYSANDMTNGTYTELLNAFVNSNPEDGASALWYQSSKLGAPAPVTNLKVSQASVSVGTTPAIAVLLSGVSGLPSDAEIQLVNSTGRAVAATKVDGSRYRFDFAVELADIGLTDTYHIMVNGQKSVHSYELSVAGLLGSLYAKATDAEKNLMVAMVNYSYYAGNASAFDVFNAVASTAFAPSVDGAEAIADAGSVSIESGYEVALSIEKGFVIIVTKDGEEISQHTKSVLNATDIVNLGSAGSVSVAAMLNYYLDSPAHADLAKAAILFYEAAVAAQNEAGLKH